MAFQVASVFLLPEEWAKWSLAHRQELQGLKNGMTFLCFFRDPLCGRSGQGRWKAAPVLWNLVSFPKCSGSGLSKEHYHHTYCHGCELLLELFIKVTLVFDKLFMKLQTLWTVECLVSTEKSTSRCPSRAHYLHAGKMPTYILVWLQVFLSMPMPP